VDENHVVDRVPSRKNGRNCVRSWRWSSASAWRTRAPRSHA